MKPRKSKFAADANEAQRMLGQRAGITDLERELLMVDDDREQIMYARDSTKIGKYLIQAKMGFQNDDMTKQLSQNIVEK